MISQTISRTSRLGPASRAAISHSVSPGSTTIDRAGADWKGRGIASAKRGKHEPRAKTIPTRMRPKACRHHTRFPRRTPAHRAAMDASPLWNASSRTANARTVKRVFGDKIARTGVRCKREHGGARSGAPRASGKAEALPGCGQNLFEHLFAEPWFLWYNQDRGRPVTGRWHPGRSPGIVQTHRVMGHGQEPRGRTFLSEIRGTGMRGRKRRPPTCERSERSVPATLRVGRRGTNLRAAGRAIAVCPNV